MQTAGDLPNMQPHKLAAHIKQISLVFHTCPQHGCAGRRHGFHSPARDALSFLRYTCRQRALNRAPASHMCQMLPLFFRPAVPKDLKEHYFAGREDGSRLRSASAKTCKQKKILRFMGRNFPDT